MKDDNELRAEKVYKDVCTFMDSKGWKYEKVEEKLLVSYYLGGEDIPMKFIVVVDPGLQLIRLMSILPFEIKEEKKFEAAVVCSIINYNLGDGNFDYDIINGRIYFRQTAFFRNSETGVGLVRYLIASAGIIVDEYNDKFLMFNKGMMSVADFLEK